MLSGMLFQLEWSFKKQRRWDAEDVIESSLCHTHKSASYHNNDMDKLLRKRKLRMYQNYKKNSKQKHHTISEQSDRMRKQRVLEEYPLHYPGTWNLRLLYLEQKKWREMYVFHPLWLRAIWRWWYPYRRQYNKVNQSIVY